MTQSELFAIMAGGTASIAGSVMAGYAGMGVPLTYLIAASFMAAPAGLLLRKFYSHKLNNLTINNLKRMIAKNQPMCLKQWQAVRVPVCN